MIKLNSMKARFIFMMIGVSMLTVIFVGGFFIYNMVKESQQAVMEYRQMLMERLDLELKMETDIAWSTIDSFYKRQQAGELTQAQAEKGAAAAVRNMTFADGHGYFWMDTYKGINVVWKGNKAVEGKSRWNDVDSKGQYVVRTSIEQGQKQGGGYFNDTFPKPGTEKQLPKRNYSLAFAPYHWVLGTGVWIDDLEASVAKVQAQQDDMLKTSIIQIVVFMIVLQGLLAILALYVARRLSNPIEHITQELNTLAEGNFNTNISQDVLDRMDELGVMGRAMNKLHDNIRNLMQKITSSSDYMTSAAQKLTSNADQSAAASNQVADSMVNVADLCSNQFKAVTKAEQRSSELAQHMQKFSSELANATENIDKTNAMAKDGNKAISAAVEQMVTMKSSVEDTAKVIAGLGDESKKIGVIVDTIANIASQTNLLALNAAIEAARAGEQGKGFAVVAEEVRKLAEESHTAADEIAKLIGAIQKEAQNAVDIMQTDVSQVKNGTEAVSNAGRSFGEILQMVASIADQSRAMSGVVDGLSGNVNEITDTVNNINKMSKGVSSEAENVSAATEEQTASIQEIAESSRRLSSMAQELQAALSQFRL